MHGQAAAKGDDASLPPSDVCPSWVTRLTRSVSQHVSAGKKGRVYINLPFRFGLSISLVPLSELGKNSYRAAPAEARCVADFRIYAIAAETAFATIIIIFCPALNKPIWDILLIGIMPETDVSVVAVDQAEAHVNGKADGVLATEGENFTKAEETPRKIMYLALFKYGIDFALCSSRCLVIVPIAAWVAYLPAISARKTQTRKDMMIALSSVFYTAGMQTAGTPFLFF
jgi:hypothetical protein